MFGESSFETNPSLEEGDEYRHGRSSTVRGGGRNSSSRYRVQQNTHDLVNEDLTDAASNSSRESDAEPSFFIIPPKDSDIFREQKKVMPWERATAAKTNGIYEGSIVPEPGESVLSVTSSGTYNMLGAYRRDRLFRDIDTAGERGTDGHAAILKTLKRAGVLIFIVDSKVSSSLSDMMESVHNVITHARKLRRESSDCMEYEDDVGDGRISKAVCDSSNKSQQCILYRDPDGRLFNLILASHTTALAGAWEALQQSFSVLQAMTILAVLSRSFSCSTMDITMSNFGPAYLAVILGLVFSEELSLSWTNVGMFVRGFPSISSFEIVTRVESDWMRKVLLLCLSVGSAASGTTRKICTLAGISLACCILLANLGSRSWKSLGWKPAFTGDSCFCGIGELCGLQRLLEPILSYALAVVAGIFLPYLGHQEAMVGGTAAIESVIRIAIVVAGLFLLSDRDEVQNFLVIGSGECPQDYVNMAVGGWFCLSLTCSLACLGRIKTAEYWPDSREPLLVKDHASPLGLKVPHLPDFPIDPTFALKGSRRCVTANIEFLVGVLFALGIGGFFVYIGFSDLDDQFPNSLARQ